VPAEDGVVLAALRAANPEELALAAGCFAAATACAAASWRTMLGGSLSFCDACARYGAGSLVNTLVPARAGDAVRLGLFGRVAPGGLLAAGGAAAAVGAARWLLIVPLGIAAVATAGSPLPPLAVAAAGVAVVPLAVAALLACRGSRRARALLAPLRTAGPAGLAVLAVWVGATVAARICAAALAAAALGIAHPLAAALLIVPALELAGIVPLTPANIGVAGSAAAIALHARGVPLHTALAAGLALHGVETATGLVVGGIGAATLLRRPRGGATVVELPRLAALRDAA
jgi:glycosyltransferase 2 family protein